MLDITTKLSKIFKKLGSDGTSLYVWGKSTILQGFAGLSERLGATPDDDLWIELDSYKDTAHLRKLLGELRKDEELRPHWDRLMRLVGPGRPIEGERFDPCHDWRVMKEWFVAKTSKKWKGNLSRRK